MTPQDKQKLVLTLLQTIAAHPLTIDEMLSIVVVVIEHLTKGVVPRQEIISILNEKYEKLDSLDNPEVNDTVKKPKLEDPNSEYKPDGQSNTQYLRERIELRANLAKFPYCGSVASLRAEQWSKEFEVYRRNRMVMGAMRYGPFRDPNKPTYKNVDSIIKRAQRYRLEGNDELLVDIANLAMCEFIEGVHPKKHFSAEDDGEHTKTK